jgi:hypothetical protein
LHYEIIEDPPLAGIGPMLSIGATVVVGIDEEGGNWIHTLDRRQACFLDVINQGSLAGTVRARGYHNMKVEFGLLFFVGHIKKRGINRVFK